MWTPQHEIIFKVGRPKMKILVQMIFNQHQPIYYLNTSVIIIRKKSFFRFIKKLMHLTYIIG
jgi:hypothetical protein